MVGNVNCERIWLMAMVDSGTNVILHVRLYALRNTVVRKILYDGCRTFTIDHAEYLFDVAPWYKSARS